MSRMCVAGSASPPVLFRRRDLYRPLRLHRLALSRPRPDLNAGSGSRPRSDLGFAKPSMPRRPVTPSDKADSRSFSAQTRTGRSLSSLTATSAVPVSADKSARTLMTTSTPSAASGTTRDPSRATAAVNKLSRTLVKSLSADKAKPAATGERRPTSTEPSVSKSQSAMNVKKHAKSTMDEKELARKETKTAKVSLRMLLCLNSGISEKNGAFLWNFVSNSAL